MSYVKQTWVDRAVEFFRRFSASEDVDGNISLTEEPGVITSAGTPLDASRLNHMEDGIASAHDDIDKIKAGGDTDGRFATMPWVGTAPILTSGSSGLIHWIHYADGTAMLWANVDWSAPSGTGNILRTLTIPSGVFHESPIYVTYQPQPNAYADLDRFTRYAPNRRSNWTATQVQARVIISTAFTTSITEGWLVIGRWK